MSKFPDILLPDHPAYIEAVEAMHRCAPTNEVERLRLIAESLFQAVTDYQMQAFGKGGRAIH
ncbi:hypothetical protein [Pseudomonas mosselii]|uniref:hypothetical protein n=1 Tax=Pseudomonas mosselii TaxID=78327 RepID=UPI0016482CFF|nr:hypothetical protein [Pseudomonas mosselii]MBC3455984.1 hypothetical protein [Pseudomonas mosselii]